MYSKFAFLCIFLLLQLSACVGGGGDGIASGGIDGTSLGVGSISQFGSIFVNDIEYNTDQVDVFINGQNDGIEQLKLGMYVRVLGSQNPDTNQGVAQRIEYRDTLRGAIEFISEDTPTLRILDQTVRLTENTYRYGFSKMSELQIGDIVRVSGPAISGSIQNGVAMTLMERLTTTSEDEVAIMGTVFNLDNTTRSFFINGTRIHFANTQTMPQLRDNMNVAVTGQKIPEQAAIQATHIYELAIENLPEGSFIQIVGNVTRFVDTQDFDVEYHPVRLAQSISETLQTAVMLGSQVRLSGYTDTTGVIDIEHFNIFDQLDIGGTPNDLLLRVSGTLHMIDLDAQRINVFGVPVLLSPRSRYQDISGSNPEYDIADLRLGDYMSIAGVFDAHGQFELLQLNYEPFVTENLRQLQGNSSELDVVNQQLQILGVSVLTNTETEYFDVSQQDDFKLPPVGSALAAPSDTRINAVQFFQQLDNMSDNLTYALGDAQGDTLLAKILVILPFMIEP